MASFFVCADGGANSAAVFGATPDIIVGDLDSITRGTTRRFKRVKILRMPDQNSTDLEKALSYVLGKGYREVVVLGGTGGRLDHLAGNLSALGKFSRRAAIRFVDDEGVLQAVGREFVLEAPRGTTVSLIPLSACTGIKTSGLKWELKNESLELGKRESTSNVVRRARLTRVGVGVGSGLFRTSIGVYANARRTLGGLHIARR